MVRCAPPRSCDPIPSGGRSPPSVHMPPCTRACTPTDASTDTYTAACTALASTRAPHPSSILIPIPVLPRPILGPCAVMRHPPSRTDVHRCGVRAHAHAHRPRVRRALVVATTRRTSCACVVAGVRSTCKRARAARAATPRPRSGRTTGARRPSAARRRALAVCGTSSRCPAGSRTASALGPWPWPRRRRPRECRRGGGGPFPHGLCHTE
jgi:hypothetical protein